MWSVRRIIEELSISYQTYEALYTQILESLRKSNLLQQRLNSVTRRHDFRNATLHIFDHFPEVFQQLPDDTKDKSILAIAYRCNHNSRRQKQHAEKSDSDRNQAAGRSRTRTTQAVSTADSDTRESVRPALYTSVDNLKIFVKAPVGYTGRESLLLSTRELVNKTALEELELSRNNIALEDLDFGQFEQRLAAAVGYIRGRHALSYSLGKGVTQEIIDEREWKLLIEHATQHDMNGLAVFSVEVKPSVVPWYNILPRVSSGLDY